jgi:hypothetical protein
LAGATHRCRLRCDETEPLVRGQPITARPRTSEAQPTRLALRCTLAQPTSSPTSLVGSYPTVSPLTPASLPQRAGAGLLSVAVVVSEASRLHCPHFWFRGAPLLLNQDRAESREVPLRSRFVSSAADRLLPSARSRPLYQRSMLGTNAHTEQVTRRHGRRGGRAAVRRSAFILVIWLISPVGDATASGSLLACSPNATSLEKPIPYAIIRRTRGKVTACGKARPALPAPRSSATLSPRLEDSQLH